jgi:hypothetical protein
MHRMQVAGAWLGCVVAAAGGVRQDAAAPADRFKSLLAEYERAGSGGAPSDAERTRLIGRVFRRRSELAQQFLDLAKQSPADPIALDALIQAVWQVNTTPWPLELVGPDPAAAEALTLLQRDHMKSTRLAPLCQRLSFGFREEYEPFLRAVLAGSDDRTTRGIACFTLAHFLANRAQRLEAVAEQPQRVAEFEALFGAEYVRARIAQGPEPALTEAETLLETAAAKYADVKLSEDALVGERATAELFELRHLRIGKEAPDIVGEDQDGAQFRLSEYRGKVVLLDFWHQQ